jgi:hypothetical protein
MPSIANPLRLTALLLAGLLLAPAWSVAQAPKPSFSVPNTDIFAGYVVNVPDYATAAGSTHNLQGYELAFTLHLGNRLGLTAAGGQTFSTAFSPGQYQLTAGPRFNFLTGRFRPYGTAQFGVSNQDSDHLHPGELTAALSRRNALTYRVGGGADYQLTRRIYWRIGQWTVQPVPWGRHASSLFQNFSTGLGYQF